MKTTKQRLVYQKLLPLIGTTTSIQKLAYLIDISYSHVHKTILEMEENKWLEIKKKGRSNTLKLTEKGQKVADACKIIGEEIEKIY